MAAAAIDVVGAREQLRAVGFDHDLNLAPCAKHGPCQAPLGIGEGVRRTRISPVADEKVSMGVILCLLCGWSGNAVLVVIETRR
jgi:hypothetical protein